MPVGRMGAVAKPMALTSPAPYALYDFLLDGAGDLLGRGTSGNKFRAIDDSAGLPADVRRWENSNFQAGWESEAPFLDSLDDFGGSWCDAPLTFVAQTSAGDPFLDVAHDMTDGSGFFFAVESSILLFGGTGFISVALKHNLDGSTYRETLAYWDIDGTAPLTAGDNRFVLTLNPASVSHSLLINGVEYTANAFHSNTAGSCATFDAGPYPAPRSRVSVGGGWEENPPLAVTGMAWVRGPADDAYWASYDWGI